MASTGSARGNPPARPGFTLTELLVSLVILVGMMTLIATIFATAGKSSGVAQAQARLHRQLLQVADVISGDLANTQTFTDAAGAPKGVLAIAGVVVKAKDTAKSPTTDVRRADVLMLLTQQQFEPFIYTPPAGTLFDDFKLVVYGHADIGKVNPANGEWFSTVNYVESGTVGASEFPLSDMLASEWHLARRVVGFVKSASDNYRTIKWPLASPEILGIAPTDSTTDVIYDNRPLSYYLGTIRPGFYAYNRLAGGTIELDEFYLESINSFRYFWYRGLYHLLDANYLDPYAHWWRRTDTNQWSREEGGPKGPIPRPDLPFAEVAGYSSRTHGENSKYRFWPAWFCNPGVTGSGSNIHRTRIDPMPPPGMPERTAAYFLPSCSEFKVEFTYDDPREVAVDPSTGQPFPGPDFDGDGDPDVPAASPVNWQTVPRGEIYVWTGLSTDTSIYTASGDLRDRTFPFRWPRALRITIKAYAPGGALDYPIEHTLIHVWQ